MKRKPLQTVFTQEIVLVQSYGVGEWLKQRVSDELGIAAMIDAQMPSTFMWKLLERLQSETSPYRGLFDKDKLRWEILRLLPEKIVKPEYAILNAYIESRKNNIAEANADSVDEVSLLFELSHQIADLFDAYLNYRSDWILSWEDETNNEAVRSVSSELVNRNLSNTVQTLEAWQKDLWCSLYPEITMEERAHRAQLLDSFLSDFHEPSSQVKARYQDKIRQLGLPERIFVFGLSALPLNHLSVFEALSRLLDIHWLATNPCKLYWGDSQTQKQQLLLQKSLLEKGISDETASQTFLESNELLASWGGQGREYISILADKDYPMFDIASHAETLYHDVGDVLGKSALQSIQSGILNLEKKSTHVSVSDKSLRFADCHSALREVESLRDYLLDLLESDKGLNLEDVIVMTPQIERYAPFIDAIFSQPLMDSAGTEHLLKYSISDQGLASENGFVECFSQILTIDQSRLEVSAILAWLNISAIREKLSLDDEELGKLNTWLNVLNTHWGLNKDDKEAVFDNASVDGRHTWLESLQRLITGYLLGESELVNWGGVRLSPATIFGVDEFKLVGKLARLIDRLLWTRSQVARSATLEEHIELAAKIWNTWVDTSCLPESLSKLFLTQLELIKGQIDSTSFDGLVPFRLIAKEIMSVFDNEKVSQKFSTGVVNFCTLMPMRTVPFKVVCLLGMNEGDYPRIRHQQSFDLMNHTKRRVGDRSAREDDRYLFLEAVCSARQYLYISYCGRDIRDNTPRYPSILVQELREYCESVFQLEDTDRADNNVLDAWTMTHRLQPFHEDYYRSANYNKLPANHNNLSRSFSAEWLSLLNKHVEHEKPLEHENTLNFAPAVQSPVEQIDLFSLVTDEHNHQASRIDGVGEDKPGHEDNTKSGDSFSLSLDDFSRILVNPLKFFYAQRTGFLANWLDIPVSDAEPFAIENTVVNDLKFALVKRHFNNLGRALAPHDERLQSEEKINNEESPNERINEYDHFRDVFEQFYYAGDLPDRPVADFYCQQALDDTFHIRRYLEEHQEREILEFYMAPTCIGETNIGKKRIGETHIVGDEITLSSRLMLLNSMPHTLTLSKKGAHCLFTSWVKHVCVSAQCDESYREMPWRIVFQDRLLTLPALDKALAKEYLQSLLNDFSRLSKFAVPFFPNSAYALIFETENKALQAFRGTNTGQLSYSGEKDELVWRRYCEFQSSQDPDLIPDYEEYSLFKQMSQHAQDINIEYF